MAYIKLFNQEDYETDNILSYYQKNDSVHKSYDDIFSFNAVDCNAYYYYNNNANILEIA